jgi:hypothetical protein
VLDSAESAEEQRTAADVEVPVIDPLPEVLNPARVFADENVDQSTQDGCCHEWLGRRALAEAGDTFIRRHADE